MVSFKTRIERAEQAMGSVMQPGQLPEDYLITCFDRANDDQGNELPIIEMAGIFRQVDEDEDSFLQRVLKTVCVGQPLGVKPMLIAHRQAPKESEHVVN